MKTEDLEKALKEAKYHHLKDDVLISYRDQQLDAISRTKAEAHLNLCLICERRLLLFQGERAAMDNYEPTAEDRVAAKQALRQVFGGQTETTKAPVGRATLERFTEYVRQAAASWQAFVIQLTPVRGATRSTEIWRWQSEDERFIVYMVVEPTADLTLHFSTSDPGLEGARLKVKTGPLSHEATLQRISESESHAEVTIKRRQRPKHLTAISIEIA
jgi:hypothetical protein